MLRREIEDKSAWQTIKMCVQLSGISSAYCFRCRLLVGAPRARALSGQKASVTGGLYSCDMSSPNCRRITFDNSGEISAGICALIDFFFYLKMVLVVSKSLLQFTDS